MDSIVINGGKTLNGTIRVSGAKNASLPIIAAALLTDDKVILTNIPKLTDIISMKVLLEDHGAKIDLIEENDCYKLVINCSYIHNFTAEYELVRKMRASFWVLGPLVAKHGSAKVSMPGGCALGARLVDLHLQVLESMGATITIEHGYVIATTNGKLQGTNFRFSKISVGATINAIMAATLAEGKTVLTNCAIEPEIVDLCKCLKSMGAQIEGIGTSEILIIGQKELHGTEYDIMPDRIEAGTYMIAAAITKGNLLIEGIDFSLVENLAYKLGEANILVETDKYGIRVKSDGNFKPINIDTAPYPGFATDLQAQFMSLITLASGISRITENLYENRFMHVPELCRLGANIHTDGNTAVIKGVGYLSGAEVMASDLRASVCLVLAGLVAEGTTIVRRVYHLDRGYQSLEDRLSKCGADITRVKGNSII